MFFAAYAVLIVLSGVLSWLGSWLPEDRDERMVRMCILWDYDSNKNKQYLNTSILTHHMM